MEYKLENDDLIIVLSGRIDSSNASSIEKEIDVVRADHLADNTVLDLENLEYLSSAGLRIILRLKKSNPSLRIINVCPEVYEIFDMTGFTEMMDISKAYRNISVAGCEVIGQGANGKVYKINEDTIVKVYMSPDSLDDINRERELAKKAFVLGIPTAISYDVVRVEGGYGTVFEMLSARSFAKLLNADPEHIDHYVNLYVDLLKKIHSTTTEKGEMPDMRATAIKWAEFDKDYLPADVGEKLVALVKAVPEDNHLLHGDYHVKNVMMQGDEVLLIDMDTLCLGNPVFELGSMFNAYEGFSSLDPKLSPSFLGISHELAVEFWNKSLSAYLNGDEEKIAAAADKAAIVGFMRLLRRIVRRGALTDPEKKPDMDFYVARLTELVRKTDTLIL